MSELDKVTASLNREIEALKRRSVEGFLAAGRIIEQGARDMVPIHSGELRDSSYTKISDDDPNVVEVGFSAEYASIIHQDDDMKLEGEPRRDGDGEYWGPDGTADFLTKSIEENRDAALQAIVKSSR